MANVLIHCEECREEGGEGNGPSRPMVGGQLIKETEKGTEFLLSLSCGHEVPITVNADEKKSIMVALGYNIDQPAEEE
jgi:hypothetical protein